MPVRESREKSTVVRLLAVGVPPDVVAERVSRRRPAGPFTIQDLHDVFAEAAVLTRERSLVPPAHAAFVDGYTSLLGQALGTRERGLSVGEAQAAARKDPRGRPSAAGLDGLRELSQRLVDAFLTDDRESPDFPRPDHEETHGLALRYVEGLFRQGEVLEALASVTPENAPLHASLGPAERKRVEEVLLYRSIFGVFHTFDGLVDRWRRSVAGLETDSDSLLHEEYENDLDVRDRLADVLSLLEDHEFGVRDLDERFRAATRPVAGSVRPGSPWHLQRWWWFRVPRQMGDAFRKRLTYVAPAVLESDPDSDR